MKFARLRPAGRLTAVSAVLALAATTAPAQAAAPQPGQAAQWLGRQIDSSGLVHNAQYDFDDYGLTVDTAMGIMSVRGRTQKVVAAREALAAHVEDYTTGKAWGSSDVYAGPTAKAAVFAQLSGARAKHFGGVNVIHQLAGLVAANGRLTDRTTGTDNANVLGQAYAARALSTAHHPKARSAVRFLLEQQCPAGWFRLEFSPKSGPQSCAQASADTKVPDTDATAIAVLQLKALPKQSRAVKRAERRAVRWLVRHQLPSGAFGGGVATSAANTNSTGLAAAVLAIAGRCKPARSAARWVGRMQVSQASGPKLAHEIGAIAYDRAGLTAAKATGIDTPNRDQWRRATSQAVLGLAAAASCQ